MVKIITNKETFDISNKTIEQDLRRLNDLLTPNIPVMIENSYHNSASRRIGAKITKTIFFSNGEISQDGYIASKNNDKKTVHATANISEKDEEKIETYKLHQNTSPKICKISTGFYSTQTQYNEGTFSPAGASQWETNSSGGTNEIWIGDKVKEQFPKTLNAILFAEDGYLLEIPTFYSMPGYLVKQLKLSNDEQDKISSYASDLVCATAAKNLIQQAGRQIGKLGEKQEIPALKNSLEITQAGWWRNSPDSFIKDGYPVDCEDYVIHELGYPGRVVGFVKTGKATPWGTTFTYPAKWNKEICDLAFSQEFVNKYYPGIKN